MDRTVDIDPLCKLLHSLLRSTEPDRPMNLNESYVSFYIEAIQVLGEIGMMLDERMTTYSTDQQQQILQRIIECFSSILICPYWTIRLYAMTAFVQFASTIPTKYKFILPQCVPSSLQKLLQCRLQNKVYLDDTTTWNEHNVGILQQQWIDKFCNILIRQHDESRRSSGCYSNDDANEYEQEPAAVAVAADRPEIIDDRISKSTSSTFVTVPVGSYCMTMPTQEGRTALVIFPPDAMDDICTMIQQQQQQEDDDDNDAEVNNDMVGSLEWMEEHHIQRLNNETVLSFETRSA
jgi:hypothetical protein